MYGSLTEIAVLFVKQELDKGRKASHKNFSSEPPQNPRPSLIMCF